LGSQEFTLEVLIDLVSDSLNVLLSDDSFSHQLICVANRLSFHIPNNFVHKRLRERRLIDFIMTIESESNHINQDVFLVLLPVSNHQLRAPHDTLWATSVNPQDWHIKWFDDISRVLKRTVIIGVGREANLVVCDDVHAAVASELGQF